MRSLGVWGTELTVSVETFRAMVVRTARQDLNCFIFDGALDMGRTTEVGRQRVLDENRE